MSERRGERATAAGGGGPASPGGAPAARAGRGDGAPPHDADDGAPLPGAARLLLVVTALLFSTGGAAIKACSLTSWQVASFRSGVAALALLVLLPGARRRWTAGTLLVGLAYAATVILFVQANKRTTAAAAIFLQSTAPLYVLLLGPWLLREWFRRRDVLVMLVVAAGMALLVLDPDAPATTAPDPFTGNVMGATAGVSWAFTLLGLRRIGRGSRHAGLGAVVCGNIIACLVGLPFALPVTASTGADWGLIAFLGVFQIGIAYALLTRGIRGVPALEASLILLLEPALNPLWAALVHGEQPGATALVGGLLILGATTAKMIADARARGRAVRGGPTPAA